jgi:hypothetical protein
MGQKITHNILIFAIRQFFENYDHWFSNEVLFIFFTAAFNPDPKSRRDLQAHFIVHKAG